MTNETQLLGIAVDQVTDFGFLWTGTTSAFRDAAAAVLDEDERALCTWVRDLPRFVTLLKRIGPSNAAVQFFDSDRRVFSVSRDHLYRPAVDPYPRLSEDQSGHNCGYCGQRINHDAVDIPTRKMPKGHMVHEICADMWQTLPKAKKDARPALDAQVT